MARLGTTTITRSIEVNYRTHLPRALCLAVLAFLACTFGLSSSASAIEYVFDYVPPPTSCSPDVDYTKANRIEARFNTVTKRFRWSVNFAPPPVAEFPTMYYIVVNDGPMPRGQPGTLAIFYFDALDVNAPKLTVYGYSGENNGQSYRDGSQAAGTQAPDKILSSLVSQDWINELSVTTLPNGSRTLTFDIDATSIINHTPLYPDAGAPWFGTGFAQHVGLWFHMFRTGSMSYGSDGFLNDFYGSEDCYDLENLTTVEDQPPVCNPGSQAYQNECEGVLTTIPLDGSASFDPEQQPLSYLWSTNCANGTIDPTNTAQTVLTLTNPGMGQAQSCAVTLTVSDGHTEVSCPASVETPACELDCLNQPNGSAVLDECGVCNGSNSCVDCEGIPFGGKTFDRCNVCGGDGTSCLGCSDVSVQGTQFAMDNNISALRALVYRATRRLLLVKKSKSNKDFAARVRKDADKFFVAGWSSTYEIPSLAVSCTNEDFCVQSSLTAAISTFNSSSASLEATVLKVLERIARVRGSQTSGDRHTKRVANDLHQANLAASATLPQTVSSCS